MSAREAGRELDALIAEKVMGWRRVDAKWRTDLMAPPSDYVPVGGGIKFVGETAIACVAPKFSTDIAAAWLVVDKMRAAGFVASVSDMPGESIVRATASFATTPLLPTHDEYGACAETVPLAICRAALAAVGVAE